MYEPFEARIEEWQKEDPAISVAAVLQRQKEIDPSRFNKKNTRIVQRLVKAWRMEMAGLVILDGGWIMIVGSEFETDNAINRPPW